MYISLQIICLLLLINRSQFVWGDGLIQNIDNDVGNEVIFVQTVSDFRHFVIHFYIFL